MTNQLPFEIKKLKYAKISWRRRLLGGVMTLIVLLSSAVIFTNADINYALTPIRKTYIAFPSSTELFPGDFVTAYYMIYGSSESYTSYILSQDTTNDHLDWGVDDIDAEIVWGGDEGAVDVLPGTINGEGVNVAVIDTGIDRYHPDLKDNYVGGYNCVKKDDETWDPTYIKDEHGHGTHVAGIIAAEDNDEGIIGVAPKVNLYAVRAIDANGHTEPEYILNALKWCIRTHKDDTSLNDIDVICMSFGLTASETTSFWRDRFEEFESTLEEAYRHNILLVAASGNEGLPSISYPAKFPEVIAVGAIDKNKVLWNGSNWEEALSYGEGQELVAPGVNILSTTPRYETTLTSNTDLENNYGKMDGTSMAAPMVAGVCSLLVQYRKEHDPTLTIGEIRDIMHISATDLGPKGYDGKYGYGEVNAARALDTAKLYHLDTDNDGLNDAEEKYHYHTSLYDPDTDDDGLTDGEEVLVHLTNPLDSDSDSDGLNDYEEVVELQTNPNLDDTDGDGCPDGWEVQYGFEPTVTNGALDPDGDTLRNIDEYTCGTDPLDRDTDNDGIPDDWEVWRNTNPLQNDANCDYDYDGLTNLEEYEVGTGPWASDTDGDGWSDYLELSPPPFLSVSDPTDPYSTPSGGSGGFV